MQNKKMNMLLKRHLLILSIALIIVTIFLLFYFNSKLQKTVESLEIKDDLTLIQKEDNSWINNVNVE